MANTIETSQLFLFGKHSWQTLTAVGIRCNIIDTAGGGGPPLRCQLCSLVLMVLHLRSSESASEASLQC